MLILAFDVSAQVPPSSWYGTILKGTINFSPQTTWLELVVWFAYVVPVMFLFVRMVRPSAPAPAAAPVVREQAEATAGITQTVAGS